MLRRVAGASCTLVIYFDIIIIIIIQKPPSTKVVVVSVRAANESDKGRISTPEHIRMAERKTSSELSVSLPLSPARSTLSLSLLLLPFPSRAECSCCYISLATVASWVEPNEWKEEIGGICC